jgi:hypothetical protein
MFSETLYELIRSQGEKNKTERREEKAHAPMLVPKVP